MNNRTFLKLSVIVVLAAMLILGGLGGAAAQSNRQVPTMPAMPGMPGGMMMPGLCPPGIANAVFSSMKAMMMAGSMMATMPAMMATMPAMPPGMMPTMPAMPPGMMPTMPAMVGTMPAMPPGMMTQACEIAILSGKNETPGSGDAKGYGVAVISLDATAKTISFEVMVADLKLPASASHIHKGAAGVAGGVVVDAKGAPDAQGMYKGTATDVDATLLADIIANPANYYYNVHNADFPAGAIRGQLASPMDLLSMMPGMMPGMPPGGMMPTMPAAPTK